jgi:hypothetical protein
MSTIDNSPPEEATQSPTEKVLQSQGYKAWIETFDKATHGSDVAKMGGADTPLAKTGADFADVLARADAHGVSKDETVDQKLGRFINPIIRQQFDKETLHAFRADLIRAGHISKTTEALPQQVSKGNERAAQIARSLFPIVKKGDGFAKISDQDAILIMRISRELAGLELADEQLRGEKKDTPSYEPIVANVFQSLAETGKLPKVSTLLGENSRYEDSDPLLQKDVDIVSVQEDAILSAERWTYFARWQALLSEFATKSSIADSLQGENRTQTMQALYRINSPRGFSSVPVAESSFIKAYHALTHRKPDESYVADPSTVQKVIEGIKGDLSNSVAKQEGSPSPTGFKPKERDASGKIIRRW